jgi:hypothetical protein
VSAFRLREVDIEAFGGASQPDRATTKMMGEPLRAVMRAIPEQQNE